MANQIKPSMWCPGINTTAPSSLGSVADFPMWSGSGSRIMDLSGNGNSGTFVGTAAWGVGEEGATVLLPDDADNITLNTPITIANSTPWSISLRSKGFGMVIGAATGSAENIWLRTGVGVAMRLGGSTFTFNALTTERG